MRKRSKTLFPLSAGIKRGPAPGASAKLTLPYLGKRRQREAVSLKRARSTASLCREYRNPAHVTATHPELARRCQSARG